MAYLLAMYTYAFLNRKRKGEKAVTSINMKFNKQIVIIPELHFLDRDTLSWHLPIPIIFIKTNLGGMLLEEKVNLL